MFYIELCSAHPNLHGVDAEHHAILALLLAGAKDDVDRAKRDVIVHCGQSLIVG